MIKYIKRILYSIFFASFLLFGSAIPNSNDCKETKEVPKVIRVYVDMVADLFHPGHVNFLRQAKKLGTHLIVGVHSDEDCEDYKRKTIYTLEERVAAVAGCKYVNEIIPHAPLSVNAEYLDKHNINIVAHGDDFDPVEIKKYYGSAINREIFRTIPYTKGISTSEILRRILSRDPESFKKK